jgi:CheY-like chemotaxis protein
MTASRRILVIESNADAGQALCALLELWGHNTVLADTGRWGVQSAIRESPEVIVLDLGLPDLDGCKVVQLIRSAPTGNVPVIIAYSGYHHREAEAQDAGCDAFVLKPAVEELESLILGTRQQARRFVETAGSAVARRR